MTNSYKDQVKDGYIQVKLSKKQHNELFAKRRIKFGQKYEYYLSDNEFIMYSFPNIFMVLLITLAFPILVLINGIKDFKELCKEIVSLWHHESGSWDSVGKGTNLYSEISKFIVPLIK